MSENTYPLRQYPHTPEQIAKELRIDEEGNLWWKQDNKSKQRKMNEPAGSSDAKGYLQVSVGNKRYKAHTLAFCLYYMRWPSSGKVIDHVNGNTIDNRKSNLREVSYSTNLNNRHKMNSNNTTGYTGVFKSQTPGKFIVRNRIGGVQFFKSFDSIQAAIEFRNKSKGVQI